MLIRICDCCGRKIVKQNESIIDVSLTLYHAGAPIARILSQVDEKPTTGEYMHFEICGNCYEKHLMPIVEETERMKGA